MVGGLLVVSRAALEGRARGGGRREERLAVDRVLNDLLGLCEENLALEERKEGEDEEHEPHCTHEDGHDEVPGEESLQLKGVSEHADGRDPANCESAVNTNPSFGERVGDIPLGKVRAQPVKGRTQSVHWRRPEDRGVGLTSENLLQVLVKLEPVGEQTEEEQEHRETE